MKIKTKKTMNLPQLIEWAFKNDITNEWYRATNDIEYISEVFFNISGLPQLSDTVDKSDLFTIEVEEEITEDTVFDKKEQYTENGWRNLTYKCSINDVKDEFSKEFYIYDDDGKMTLIWRDGKLVE